MVLSDYESAHGLLKRLLDAKAAVDFISEQQHSRGETALHSAVRRGKADIVELLLNYGADCNKACSKERNTPLHLACAMGKFIEASVPIVELLLAAKADIHAPNRSKQTPLKMARSNAGSSTRSSALARLLEEYYKAQQQRSSETLKHAPAPHTAHKHVENKVTGKKKKQHPALSTTPNVALETNPVVLPAGISEAGDPETGKQASYEKSTAEVQEQEREQVQQVVDEFAGKTQNERIEHMISRFVEQGKVPRSRDCDQPGPEQSREVLPGVQKEKLKTQRGVETQNQKVAKDETQTVRMSQEALSSMPEGHADDGGATMADQVDAAKNIEDAEGVYVCMYVCMYVCIYIYTLMSVCIYILLYVHSKLVWCV